jgi:hypothetical protein
VLSCAGAWSENVAGSAYDAGNDACAGSQSFEAVEIRNDTPSSLSIANWTVRNGAGTTCLTVPAATTLAAGAVYRASTTTGACFADAADTVRLFDAGGVAQGTRAFSSTCTPAVPRKAVLSCAGAWTENVAGGGDDATNNACGATSSFEYAEIRNDTPVTANIAGWTVRNGGTTCATVPAGTTLAAGAVYRALTTSGSCFTDAGGLISINDTGGIARANRAYTSTCTNAAPRRSVLSCAGTWTDNIAAAGNDTSNDSCTNLEGVDIRNDTGASLAVGGYTIRNGATVCATIPAGTTLAAGASLHANTLTGTCLSDGAGTVTINDGAGTVVASKVYSYSCAAAHLRSVLSCTGTWSEGVTPATAAFDTTNDACAASQVFETVEIRNDTPAVLNAGGWTIRNGSGTVCATIPPATALASGANYRITTNTGTCLPDGTDTVRLYNGATEVASRAYTNTGCSVAAPRRSVMSCGGVWSENQVGGTDDISNNSCSHFEAVEIRNDTAAAINPNGWLIKAGTGCGGTTCATVATGSLAAGTAAKINTTTGTCLNDSNGTVTLCNGATPVASRTYSYSCQPSNPLRSVFSCAGSWSDSVAGSAFDGANNSCTGQIFEAVEIRNDTPVSQNITGWTVRNGATVCATVPAVTLTAGTSWRGYTDTGTCLTDGSGTLSVHDSGGALQNSQGYASACGTHGLLTCAGTWTNSVAGQAPDASNNTCSGTFEFIELRNDTAGTVNIGGWTARVGATTCFTVPAGTQLTPGGVYQGATSTGTCMPDPGSGTISVYDAGGALQSSQAYNTTCTVAAPNRGVLSCAGAWTNNNAGGTAVASNNGCTLSASYNASGTTLRVRDFTCGAAAGSVTCGSATKTFSNERTVVDCADAVGTGRAKCTRPANPSFLPDKSGLLYQHQIVNSGFESYLNSTYGAGAEIWITKTNSKSPVPLDNLNGWTTGGSGSVYIPTRPRHTAQVVPTGSSAGITYQESWHRATSGDTTWVGDTCSYTNQITTTREDRLNYYPTVSPQEAGDKYWAIFTSRRLYGNIAVSNPWQVQRSNAANKFGIFSGSCNTNALNAYSPGSGFIETKKLWVSAIDKNWSGTGDPSHPPFYLPGQELDAGNSHGYWAATPCAVDGGACDTNDDCCGGTGASPTFQCRVTNTSTVPATKACHAIDSCSTVNEACTTTADCCTGLTCPEGGGVCIALSGTATTRIFTREYVATCPEGTQPRWQNFEWQATLPTGTALAFHVQTKKNAAAAYQPVGTMTLPGLAIGTAPGTTAAGAWDKTAKTVDAFLRAADLSSLPYLMVSMTFRPNTAGTLSPTLKNWRQMYDCLPAE